MVALPRHVMRGRSDDGMCGVALPGPRVSARAHEVEVATPKVHGAFGYIPTWPPPPMSSPSIPSIPLIPSDQLPMALRHPPVDGKSLV